MLTATRLGNPDATDVSIMRGVYRSLSNICSLVPDALPWLGPLPPGKPGRHPRACAIGMQRPYLNSLRKPRPVYLPATRRPILRPTRPFFTALTSPRRRASLYRKERTPPSIS